MSVRRFPKKLLLLKLEPTYGTDSTPTPASDSVLALDLVIRTHQGPTETRNLDRPNLGAEIEYHTSLHTELTFRLELAASGAAGTAPAIGPVLRCCGLAETIVAATSVTYDPVSESHESATCKFNLDGKLFVLLGSRGTWRLMKGARTIPHMDVTIWGMHVKATDQVMPTDEDFSAFQTPIPVSNANTPTFTLHGYSAPMESLNIDAGQPLAHRDLVGGESIEISNRVVTGQVLLEDPLVAEQDYEATVEGHLLGALQIVHGSTAGSIITIDAPKVQLLRPTEQELHGRVGRQFDVRLTPDTGDDDVSISFT